MKSSLVIRSPLLCVLLCLAVRPVIAQQNAGRERGFLLAAVDNGIRSFSLDRSSYIQVYEGIRRTLAVAYDPLDHLVYWSDTEGVYSIPLRPGHVPSLVVNEGIGRAETLAVDWWGRNLYIVDTVRHQILACSLDGTVCDVLIGDEHGDPRVLQLDIKNRFMYWTDGDNSRIEKAGMDGSQRSVLANESSGQLRAMALDSPASRVYWMDKQKKMVFHMTTNGTDRKNLSEAVINQPYSVAVWEEYLYWTDRNYTRILSCFKHNGQQASTILNSYDQHFSSITLYHPTMLNQDPNPCEDRCSHMCLLSPSSPIGYTCTCPYGVMVLAPDRHTCQDVQNVTHPVVVTGNQMFWWVPQQIGQSSLAQWNPKLNLHKIGDLDYDPSLDNVVVSDVMDGTIYSISVTRGVSRPIVSNVARAVGVAVDWLRNNLYWVDGVKLGVEVLSTHRGFHRTEIVTNLSHPTDITLAPLHGYLYVSDAGSDPNILRCDLDGSTCEQIVKRILLHPTSLMFDRDPDNPRLYWCDSGLGSIESTAVDGSDRLKIIQKVLHQPISLLVSNFHIMWTQKNSDQLFITSKLDRQDPIKSKRLRSAVVDREDRTFKLGEVSWRLPAKILTSNHPCAQQNGNCSQFCLGNSHNSKVCACGLGFALAGDGFSCLRSSCQGGFFLCPGTDRCVPISWRCDGTRDCEGGEDEATGCMERTNPCDQFSFQCASGDCIDKTWMCDGFNDCNDGSDESSDHCEKGCSSGQWQCSSGGCIPQMWRCDHMRECSDGSDEINCPSTCPGYKFTCRDGTCISNTWQCDGVNDCPDGSDEENCHVNCPAEEFTCDNKECVPMSATCDGDPDCTDGSDEGMPRCSTLTTAHTPTCPKGYYPCAINTSKIELICIPNDSNLYRCGEKKECAVYEFHCRDVDRCIPKRWTCDGEDDCSDGSDEGPEASCSSPTVTTMKPSVDVTPAATTTVPSAVSSDQVCGDDGDRCKHGCHTTSTGGVQCSCHPGYVLAADGLSCLKGCDVEATCSQYCHQSEESYSCSCQPGYDLRPDGRTCKPERESWMLMVRPGGVLVNLSHSHQVTHKIKLPDMMNINSMDYDPLNNNLLYTDKSQGVVGMMSIRKDTDSGRFTNKILLNKRSNPQGLSYDPRMQNLYFSESFDVHRPQVSHAESLVVQRNKRANVKQVYSFVLVCGLGTRRCSQVYKARDEVIPATRVASTERRLFYCTNHLGEEDRAEVVVSFMDGKNKKVLWSNKVVRCGSLALDEAKRRIYWTDTALNKVESVTWDGRHHRVLQDNKVHSPIGLSLTGDWVIWMNLGGHQQLIRCNKTNSDVCESKSLSSTPAALLIVLQLGNVEHDTCDSSVCPHLCTSYSNTTKCLCQVGFTESVHEPGRCVEVTACASNPCEFGVCEPHTDTDYVCRCGDQCGGGPTLTSSLLTASVILVFLTCVAIGVFWYRKNIFTVCRRRDRYRPSSQFTNPTFGVMSDQGVFSNIVPASTNSDGLGDCSGGNPETCMVRNSIGFKSFENPLYTVTESQEEAIMDSATVSSSGSMSINMVASSSAVTQKLLPMSQPITRKKDCSALDGLVSPEPESC